PALPRPGDVVRQHDVHPALPPGLLTRQAGVGHPRAVDLRDLSRGRHTPDWQRHGVEEEALALLGLDPRRDVAANDQKAPDRRLPLLVTPGCLDGAPGAIGATVAERRGDGTRGG